MVARRIWQRQWPRRSRACLSRRLRHRIERRSHDPPGRLNVACRPAGQRRARKRGRLGSGRHELLLQKPLREKLQREPLVGGKCN
eukprot:COSAG01_NODE_8063_length_2934_cov_4.053968_3_plen_85_part_00